jgi:hypothetical protein
MSERLDRYLRLPDIQGDRCHSAVWALKLMHSGSGRLCTRRFCLVRPRRLTRLTRHGNATSNPSEARLAVALAHQTRQRAPTPTAYVVFALAIASPTHMFSTAAPPNGGRLSFAAQHSHLRRRHDTAQRSSLAVLATRPVIPRSPIQYRMLQACTSDRPIQFCIKIYLNINSTQRSNSHDLLAPRYPRHPKGLLVMPANYVLIQWAEQGARARGHSLSRWEQREETAVADCERCGRSVIVDFSAHAASANDELSGQAIAEDCDAPREPHPQT